MTCKTPTVWLVCVGLFAFSGCFQSRDARPGDDPEAEVAGEPDGRAEPAFAGQPPPTDQASPPQAGTGVSPSDTAGGFLPPDLDRQRQLDELNDDELTRVCQALREWITAATERVNRAVCVASARIQAEEAGSPDPVAACVLQAGECVQQIDRFQGDIRCPAEELSQCPALVSDFEGCVAGSRQLLAEYDRVSCSDPDTDLNAIPGGQAASDGIVPCIRLFEDCPDALDVLAVEL